MEQQNPLYPVFLKLAGRSVLVVGGGKVASRRARQLVEAGARVTVISPEITDELVALKGDGKIHWKEREVRPEDLETANMVYLATGNLALARDLRRRCGELGSVLLNIAEDESLCDFHVPAVASKGRVKVAVSSGGRNPAATGRIRQRLQQWLEANEDFLEAVLAQERHPASAPRSPDEPGARTQTVYLVGAGPGDPALLTVRAAELLRTADVVYYDRLVSRAILQTIPPDVEKVYVGKEVGCAQRANIGELMIQSARDGRLVVRLKAGDPWIFARGAEEVIELRQAGINLEVVPGISEFARGTQWIQST